MINFQGGNPPQAKLSWSSLCPSLHYQIYAVSDHHVYVLFLYPWSLLFKFKKGGRSRKMFLTGPVKSRLTNVFFVTRLTKGGLLQHPWIFATNVSMNLALISMDRYWSPLTIDTSITKIGQGVTKLWIMTSLCHVRSRKLGENQNFAKKFWTSEFHRFFLIYLLFFLHL